MSNFGHLALFLAWFFSLSSIMTGSIAGYRNSEKFYFVTRSLTILVAIFLAISVLVLGICFHNNDYSLQYVWQYSNQDMLPIYKVSAIWGGMDGSMLLWCFILSISSAIVAWRSIRQEKELLSWTMAVANSATVFFTTVTLYITNPFRYIQSHMIPFDGNGLNPLLQNPYMAIHPPMLYLGFTTFAIPYAFCIGALLSKKTAIDWISYARTWTLTAWIFLTVGIFLGGHWAYLELGWGGFWAWDPVENASFLPWLTGTAFLHSVMVQEKKGMLKGWNVWLIVTTYALTVFGTFLTRSGIVQSIHAFASTDVGWIFLLYLGIILFSTIYLTIIRKEALTSVKNFESLFSRETAFLINNLILLSICFSVLWGVMFPVLSEYVTGEKQTVGIPYFNAVNVPLFLLLILLMAVGPLIGWKKGNFSNFKKTFAFPFLFSLILGVVLVLAGITSFYPLLAYCLSFFVILTVFGEIHKIIRNSRESLLAPLKTRYSRFGGYIVHLGVAIVVIAITASMAHKIEREFTLAVGDVFEVGRFAVKLEDLKEKEEKNYFGLLAPITLLDRKTKEVIGHLNPELRRYIKNDESTTEVALRMGPREDVYLVLAGIDETGTKASMKVFINPLQIWLWFGGLIMVFGTLITIFSKRINANP